MAALSSTGRVGILGGSGFVGRSLARHLRQAGHALRILTRGGPAYDRLPAQAPDLELVETDIHDPLQLTRGLQSCDVAINLVGILNERGKDGSGFQHAHVALTDKLIAACRENGITRLLHVSAMNADAEHGDSHYQRSKGQAEDQAHGAAGLNVTSYRPSVIFGADDSFINRFDALLRLAPLVFPLACAKTRFAPVYVEDVAAAMVATLARPESHGQRYDFSGPHIYTLQELVEFTARCAGRKRVILPLPDLAARAQGLTFDLLKPAFYRLGIEPPFSTDNYLSTRTDSVCRHNHLADLGITPTALEDVAPDYLGNRTR